MFLKKKKNLKKNQAKPHLCFSWEVENQSSNLMCKHINTEHNEKLESQYLV